MRPRRDGGLVLTLVGCLGLIAAIVGTVVLVHQGIPGQEQAVPSVPRGHDVSPTATAPSTYGIAQVSGGGERRHVLVPSSDGGPAARPVSRPPAAASTPAPAVGIPVPAGQPAAGDHTVIAGPRH